MSKFLSRKNTRQRKEFAYEDSRREPPPIIALAQVLKSFRGLCDRRFCFLIFVMCAYSPFAVCLYSPCTVCPIFFRFFLFFSYHRVDVAVDVLALQQARARRRGKGVNSKALMKSKDLDKGGSSKEEGSKPPASGERGLKNNDTFNGRMVEGTQKEVKNDQKKSSWRV